MAPTSSSKKASSSSQPKLSPLEAIISLEAKATGKTYNPNPLVPLLNLARHSSPQVVHKAIWALHRIFVAYINDGRVGGISEGAFGPQSAGTTYDVETVDLESGSEVRSWVRERLLEYVEVLASLMRDSEDALRQSSLPLLLALLSPLSASVSDNQNILHTPYFRLILRYLFNPIDSLRGAKPLSSTSASTSKPQSKWSTVAKNQVSDEHGVLPADVLEKVQEEYWAKYDDLRWAFFKEANHLVQADRSVLAKAENLLGQLLPLTNLPRVQVDLNTFFVPLFSEPPSAASSKKGKANGDKAKRNKKKKTGEVDALPDWMATYDSESEDDATDSIPGSKKRQRVSGMSVHASIYSVQSHQSLYTTLWETVLSTVPLDEGQTRRILVGLHGEKGILGQMRADRRVRIADWLGSLVDQGGSKAMLAMNGLFVLMTKYNLDYPEFYRRLYGLLDVNMLHVKYRARFFRLLDTFLASSLLPAALVASFIKRLSRLALTAPPGGIIIVIPFIYNLFKRHPGCMVMIQRHADDDEDADGQASNASGQDPYNDQDPSPMTSNAIKSSCWELANLQTHYLASIATLAKIFTEVFTKPEYNMEDFLDHGYDTLFTTETNRKIKNAPALSAAIESGASDLTWAFAQPTEEGVEGDVVSRFWTF